MGDDAEDVSFFLVGLAEGRVGFFKFDALEFEFGDQLGRSGVCGGEGLVERIDFLVFDFDFPDQLGCMRIGLREI